MIHAVYRGVVGVIRSEPCVGVCALYSGCASDLQAHHCGAKTHTVQREVLLRELPVKAYTVARGGNNVGRKNPALPYVSRDEARTVSFNEIVEEA